MNKPKGSMVTRIGSPQSFNLIFEVPKEVADGTAPPGIYECRIVAVIAPADPDKNPDKNPDKLSG